MLKKEGLIKEGLIKEGFIYEIRKNRILFFMLIPTLLFFILFNYLPMVGVYFAFTRFNFADGLFKSPFVGFENFSFLFKSGTLWKITRNTIFYNLCFIFIGNFLQITVAILLSRLSGRIFKKLTQSIMFFPYFISFVVVQAFVYAMLDSQSGAVTKLFASLGVQDFNAYGTPSVWVYIINIVYNWKWLGYGTVIYLAAIAGINSELYEAADIDGADVVRQIRHITIPLLLPTFIILLLLALGNILRGQFEMFYQLVGNNGLLYDATDILDTYVFRTLRVTFDLGMGTAAGLYQSLFGFILIIIVNQLIKWKHPEYSLF
jgi:putative aldouronate transport system permease protein